MTRRETVGTTRGYPERVASERPHEPRPPGDRDRVAPRGTELARQRTLRPSRPAERPQPGPDGLDHVPRTRDADRRVVHARHAGLPGAHPDPEEREEPVLGGGAAAGGVLRGEKVPLAEDDEASADPANRLHDVRVLADDGIHAAAPEDGARDAPLLVRRTVDVLGAPVEVYEDDVGAEAPGAARVGPDAGRVDHVHSPRRGQRKPVRPVRVGEECDVDAAAPQEEDLARLAP